MRGRGEKEIAMYSKAKIMGHPIHPMLVGFPVTFYTSTLIAFIVYSASHNRFWFDVAVVLNWAGVGTAALAAVPGLVDWATGIPRGAPAKKTGLIHMGLNVGALTAFLINALMATELWNEAAPNPGTGIVLSAIGVLLTLPAGFLGWSLVQDHHVGVRLTSAQEALEPKRVETSHHSQTSQPAE
jgi:uncharacterized membrane protein